MGDQEGSSDTVAAAAIQDCASKQLCADSLVPAYKISYWCHKSTGNTNFFDSMKVLKRQILKVT